MKEHQSKTFKTQYQFYPMKNKQVTSRGETSKNTTLEMEAITKMIKLTLEVVGLVKLILAVFGS
jgi:hypothetical protein